MGVICLTLNLFLRGSVSGFRNAFLGDFPVSTGCVGFISNSVVFFVIYGEFPTDFDGHPLVNVVAGEVCVWWEPVCWVSVAFASVG